MSKYKTPEYRTKHAAHARENRKKNKELTRQRHAKDDPAILKSAMAYLKKGLLFSPTPPVVSLPMAYT